MIGKKINGGGGRMLARDGMERHFGWEAKIRAERDFAVYIQCVQDRQKGFFPPPLLAFL